MSAAVSTRTPHPQDPRLDQLSTRTRRVIAFWVVEFMRLAWAHP